MSTPVTELITGFDLVEWQLRIARGEKLPQAQSDIHLTGHAIEARLYTEDPYNNFLPKVGTLIEWTPAFGTGIRVDHGLHSGLEITPYYDPMIAKIIAYGETREEARERLIQALQETVDLGLVTNRPFLIECLQADAFIRGDVTTAFIETHFPKEKRHKKDKIQAN